MHLLCNSFYSLLAKLITHQVQDSGYICIYHVSCYIFFNSKACVICMFKQYFSSINIYIFNYYSKALNQGLDHHYYNGWSSWPAIKKENKKRRCAQHHSPFGSFSSFALFHCTNEHFISLTDMISDV